MSKIKKVIFLLFTILYGCGWYYTPKKPFIIIYKSPNATSCNRCDSISNYTYYRYTDANGVRNSFCEEYKLYNIGDTIK